ncbi:MAG TPA: tetratricopeptide repeat protein [Verrucomicrobiae bacterium]|nr:tetratricopeptide repeat protein [Verrucomicrobiae bacterium]
MMTTKKGRRFHYSLIVVAAVGLLVTACGPPGARELRQGEKYIQAGQFTEAITVLREATRVLADAPHPIQAKAWNLLGLACQDLGQFDVADNDYRLALKLDRDNAVVDYNLGCLRILQANFPGAIDYLTTYVALRPKDVQGYLRLGSAHFRFALEQRNATERTRLLEAARRDWEAAEAVSATPDAANDLGMLQMQRRQPTAETIRAAEANFELALKRDPQFAPALLNLAIVSQQYLRNTPQALQLYRQYLTINSNSPHGKEVTRLVHDLDMSQRISITPDTAGTPAPRPSRPAVKTNVPPSNAASAAPKPPSTGQITISTSTPAPPLANAPSSPPQVSNVAPVVQAPGETTPDANASASVPDPVVTDTGAQPHTPINQRLNPLHWFSGKPKTNDQDSADEPPLVAPGTRYEYPPFVTLIPGDRARSRNLVVEAIRARQAHHFAESIHDFQDAIEADPTYFDASLQLGLNSIQDRDYPTALESLHRALTLQGDSTEARYAFAWTLQKRGYYEDAVHELDKLIGQHPEDVRAHLLLGNLYADKLRQAKLARDQYIQALTLDPTNAQAANIRAWLQQKQ